MSAEILFGLSVQMRLVPKFHPEKTIYSHPCKSVDSERNITWHLKLAWKRENWTVMLSSDQSNKQSTIVNYDERVLININLPRVVNYILSVPDYKAAQIGAFQSSQHVVPLDCRLVTVILNLWTSTTWANLLMPTIPESSTSGPTPILLTPFPTIWFKIPDVGTKCCKTIIVLEC